MTANFLKFFILLIVIGAGSLVVYSQPDLPDASQTRPGRRSRDYPIGLQELLAKQKAERDKKEHEELLERGDEALRLAKQLETSFAQNKGLVPQDRSRLESLEKVVTKIRRGLGGDDDGSDDSIAVPSAEEPKPSTMEEAFKFLQSTTVKLVDELKKTTRFSISAVAIQSSNTVLKLVRFLRLRK